MTIFRKLIVAGLIVSVTALSACQSVGTGPGPGPAATPFEGEWIDSGGVATSSLHGGKFVSRANETGETVTTGNYTMRDQRTIDLSFYSVKSQQNTLATCLLVNSSQMNCTLASGTTFTLTRRTA